ncbi:hypothetical protein SKAU_G00097310 [Synaphobranchus kaupii]|uniref:Uncharacterized protein n=1 Tax=Synaphobranchus kaupii TaxID=118154 RepID=A0A9Q1FYP6_SYNKA|nr:hypothetical protein SKAU_G00097310 [Synaphobranchus kaupii]
MHNEERIACPYGPCYGQLCYMPWGSDMTLLAERHALRTRAINMARPQTATMKDANLAENSNLRARQPPVSFNPVSICSICCHYCSYSHSCCHAFLQDFCDKTKEGLISFITHHCQKESKRARA